MNAAYSSNGIVTSESFPKYTPDFEWKFYKALVENYFAVNAVADGSQQKKLFFAFLPSELINLISYLIDPDDLPTTSMTKILDQLSSYFDSQNTSFSLRRRNLLRRDRKEEEGIADYATALKAQISCCNFGLETNAQLCECFVLGLNHDDLTKMLGSCSEDFDALVKRALFLNMVLLDDIRGGEVSVGDACGGGDAVKDIDPFKVEVSICEFKDLGCDFEGSSKQIKQHIVAFSSNHLQLSHSFLQKKMEAQHELVTDQAQQINALKQQIDQFVPTVRQFNQQLATQKQQIDTKLDAQKWVVDQKLLTEMQQVKKQFATQKQQVDLQLVTQKKLNDEQNNMKLLMSTKQCEQLIGAQLDFYKQEVAHQFDNQMHKVDEKLDYQKLLVDKEIGKIKASGAFEFVWCIKNFAYESNADPEWQHMFYSDHFYTHRNGYRMSAALDLNCTSWSTKEVNLYLCLEPGIYDGILDWPISKRVIVTFHDQSKCRPKNTVYKDCVLYPDDFPKPLGAPDYTKRWVRLPSTSVTLDSLQKYFVKDDKMFVTILVVDP